MTSLKQKYGYINLLYFVWDMKDDSMKDVEL